MSAFNFKSSQKPNTKSAVFTCIDIFVPELMKMEWKMNAWKWKTDKSGISTSILITVCSAHQSVAQRRWQRTFFSLNYQRHYLRFHKTHCIKKGIAFSVQSAIIVSMLHEWWLVSIKSTSELFDFVVFEWCAVHPLHIWVRNHCANCSTNQFIRIVDRKLHWFICLN